MPPEVTNRAVSFGPPEVVKIQPCRPNDYEHDAGPLSGLVAIGPVMTFAAIAVLGLMWVVRVFCRWIGIALLACVLLSTSAIPTSAAILRLRVYADDANTFKEVHGETQDTMYAPVRLFIRERVVIAGTERWTQWYFFENLLIDINNERSGYAEVNIAELAGLDPFNPNNALGFELAIGARTADLDKIDTNIQGGSKAYNCVHQPSYYPAVRDGVHSYLTWDPNWTPSTKVTAIIELRDWAIRRIDQ